MSICRNHTITEATAYLHNVPPVIDPATIPSTPHNSTDTHVKAPSTDDREFVLGMGYDMGFFAAEYWPSVKDSKRFRHMTIADYRDELAADSAKSLTDEAHSGDFIEGFHMGFEDKAFDLAEAGTAGFEDVRSAGSVDGSVAVTARRLLKLLDSVRLID